MSDAILELESPQQDIAENMQPVASGFVPFSPANAREMQAKSVEVRRRKAALRRAALEDAQTPVQEPAQIEDYTAKRLARVRQHIEVTDTELDKARDPLDRERLSRSLAQLQELERILAGRPLPGALRPSGKVSRSAAGNVEPV